MRFIAALLLLHLVAGRDLSDKERLNFRQKIKNDHNNLFLQAMDRLREERKKEETANATKPSVAQRVLSSPTKARTARHHPILKVNTDAGIHNELYQGDVVLNNDQTTELLASYLANSTSRKRRQAVAGKMASLWNTVHYEFQPGLSQKTRTAIKAAISFWRQKTCINFTSSSTAANRIRFIKGDGCYSDVGMQNGVQKVSIGSGCEYFGITAHEIAHALGFWHEQERVDRDNAITVMLANIQPSLRYNFEKQSSQYNDNYNMPYEYGSVMQYDATSYSKNNAYTMVPKVHDYLGTLGSYLVSFYDLSMMNQLYGCHDVCATGATCENGGFRHPRRCSKCLCPSGWGGPTCSRRPPGCGAILNATAEFQNVTLSAGNDKRIDRPSPIYCSYQIRSPANTRVQISIQKMINKSCYMGCADGALEIKLINDHRYTGLRFCCEDAEGQTVVSEGNIVPVVMSNMYYRIDVLISYRYVDYATTPTLRSSDIENTAATYTT